MRSANLSRTKRHCGRGFTLAEVLVCAVLMAIGFIALVAAFGHDSTMAQRGEDVTIGTFLADEIRDMAFQMDFADLLDLDGAVYSPAVLSTGTPYSVSHWSQHVTVTPVSTTDLNQTVAAAGAHSVRLTVEVRAHGVPMTTQTYYDFDMEGVPFTDSGG